MKRVIQHQPHRSEPVVPAASQVQTLLQSRSELTVLIQQIERDKTLRPPSWQIGSLRRTLEGIEDRIKNVMAAAELPIRKLGHN
jgi:hypothetical protein